MDKLRGELSSRLAQLGSSLASSNDDTIMEEMTDYVISPYEGPSTTHSSTSVQHNKKQSRRLPHAEALNEDEIVNSIEAIYYADDEDFDSINHELNKLTNNLEPVEDIERERLKLKQQLTIVNKKIATLILQKSDSHAAQMDTFSSIGTEVGKIAVKVKEIRGSLSYAKLRSATALKILANQSKKKRLVEFKESLLSLRTLHRTEIKLKELIEEGQFPKAIELCLRVCEAAAGFTQFKAITDMIQKLAGTTDVIKKELSLCLPQLILRFDADKYAFVCSAYSILGKVEEGAECLIDNVLLALFNSAKSILFERVYDKPNSVENATVEELAKGISSEEIPQVFQQVGLLHCKILANFHSMLRHHIEDDERTALANGQIDDFEPGVFQTKIREKMTFIFEKSNDILTDVLKSHANSLTLLKFDELLQVVGYCSRFSDFGKIYFGSSCTTLIDLIGNQARIFFNHFHAERMSELCMFLENEIFALCPVPYQFTIFDLQEFSFLKECPKQETVNSENGSAFALISYDTLNPFSRLRREGRNQFSSSSSFPGDVPPGDLPTPTTHRDLEPNYEEPSDHIPPNLCNTALNLLRFFGRYMRMTTLIPAIASSSILAITQLFNYFFYSIYNFFGRDGPDVGEVSPTLRNTLAHVKSSVKVFSSAHNGIDGQAFHMATLSCAIQLQYPDQLYAAAERIMAVESLEFVARQLDLMRPVIESLTKNDGVLEHLDKFHSQIVSVVPEMRVQVFSCIASKALKYPVFIQQVSQTKWDITDLHSQHSRYVDFLMQDIDAFCERLAAVALCVNVHEMTRRQLWDRLFYYTFRALVQGFSESSTRCTSEGRALMQLDFQHLLGKLETVSKVRPISHTNFVEAYIKAYYLPESSLEQWVTAHSAEYSSRQLIALLNTASHVSRKARQRIANALDL